MREENSKIIDLSTESTELRKNFLKSKANEAKLNDFLGDLESENSELKSQLIMLRSERKHISTKLIKLINDGSIICSRDVLR